MKSLWEVGDSYALTLGRIHHWKIRVCVSIVGRFFKSLIQSLCLSHVCSDFVFLLLSVLVVCFRCTYVKRKSLILNLFLYLSSTLLIRFISATVTVEKKRREKYYLNIADSFRFCCGFSSYTWPPFSYYSLSWKLLNYRETKKLGQGRGNPWWASDCFSKIWVYLPQPRA